MTVSYEDLREELFELIADEVTIGSYDAKEIKRIALDFLQDEGVAIDERLRIRVSDMVDTALNSHYLKQQSWGSAPTDAERLEEAFLELWNRGIIAASNFADCQACGHAEMDAWMNQDDCLDKRGYVFFHQQDAQSMIKNNYLYLAFGSREQTLEANALIAEEATEVLQKHGLDAEWAGSVKTRIHITGIVWRLRRMKEIDYATDET